MSEKIVTWIIGTFGGLASIKFGRQILVFIISLMPILELRGGLLAASLLGLKPLESYLICVIANLLPVPFILWFITPIFDWLKKKGFLTKFLKKIEDKANSKKDKIEKAEFWGLLLFVGIPLPGTGAWTGSLIASMINMNKKKALLAVTLGIFMASIIMMLISFGIIGNL